LNGLVEPFFRVYFDLPIKVLSAGCAIKVHRTVYKRSHYVDNNSRESGFDQRDRSSYFIRFQDTILLLSHLILTNTLLFGGYLGP